MPISFQSNAPSSWFLRFLGSMVLLNILATILWDAVMVDRVYHCTDFIGFDYLQPGQWVHGVPLETSNVASQLSIADMGSPDLILLGWSRKTLWYAWLGFFLATIFSSVFCASFRWRTPGGIQNRK